MASEYRNEVGVGILLWGLREAYRADYIVPRSERTMTRSLLYTISNPYILCRHRAKSIWNRASFIRTLQEQID
jgi:hypothetical protein